MSRHLVCPSPDHLCGSDEGYAWTSCGPWASLKASPIGGSILFVILHPPWSVHGRRRHHARRLNITIDLVSLIGNNRLESTKRKSVLRIARSLSRVSESLPVIHSERSTSSNSVPIHGVTSKDLNLSSEPEPCKGVVADVAATSVVACIMYFENLMI